MELRDVRDLIDAGRERSPHQLDGPIGLTGQYADLERSLRAALGGDGRATVVRGAAGLGKTTLLEHVIGAAIEFDVVRVAGLQSERDLAYAGLHRPCSPMLDRVDRLPAPQRDALEAAFGLRAGREVDILVLGLASWACSLTRVRTGR